MCKRLFLVMVLVLLEQIGWGCTDFVVTASDGSLVNGRSLEFALNLEVQLVTFPRQMNRVSRAPNGKRGVSWTSKYGYIGATILGKNFSIDGMNEEGLSFGYLWMPGSKYQTVGPKEESKALDFVDFGDWILGNFASIQDLKKALPHVLIWGHALPPLPTIPPIHVAVHDAFGAHLVIEFIDGDMKVHDNPNTVLTNYPTLDWHLTNLQNFIQLSSLNAKPILTKGIVLGGSGQGTGLLGIPGDWTPPSRFVRLSNFLRFVKTPSSSRDAVNLAEHLLNTVDIPIGDVEEDKDVYDYTQWVVIKDMTHKIFYFRSYDDLSLKKIEMQRLSFTKGTASQSIPIQHKQDYLDVTSFFQESFKK